MKTKNYWQKNESTTDPFDLPKRISKGIDASGKREVAEPASESIIRYIWMYVTEDGLRHGSKSPHDEEDLGIDGWLNVIDEAASLGAEWMIVHTGASLSSAPYIWRLCEWAQEVHGLRVGLHLSSNCLSEDDLERLSRLESGKTYLLADKDDVDSLRYLEESGVQIYEANVRPDERAKYCTKPGTITCVGPDGHLFSCGLVMGDERFALGDSQDRRLSDVMNDESLPHLVPDTNEFPVGGCDACPPLVAARANERAHSTP